MKNVLTSCIQDIFHVNGAVTFMINAFPVFDQQYLRRFVPYAITFCDRIGQIAVGDQVQVIKVNHIRQPAFVQPAFYNAADGATGAVFKNQLRPASG